MCCSRNGIDQNEIVSHYTFQENQDNSFGCCKVKPRLIETEQDYQDYNPELTMNSPLAMETAWSAVQHRGNSLKWMSELRKKLFEYSDVLEMRKNYVKTHKKHAVTSIKKRVHSGHCSQPKLATLEDCYSTTPIWISSQAILPPHSTLPFKVWDSVVKKKFGSDISFTYNTRETSEPSDAEEICHIAEDSDAI